MIIMFSNYLNMTLMMSEAWGENARQDALSSFLTKEIGRSSTHENRTRLEKQKGRSLDNLQKIKSFFGWRKFNQWKSNDSDYDRKWGDIRSQTNNLGGQITREKTPSPL